MEITGLKVGMVGMGVSGGMVAEAFRSMGAEISYHCRAPMEKYEAMGITFRPLHALLERCDVVFACLNKNVLLLSGQEFQTLGSGKILFNTSIGPAYRPVELKAWLDSGENYFACDTLGAIGDPSGALQKHPHVFCVNYSAGRTRQAFGLLSEKVLDNIKSFLA